MLDSVVERAQTLQRNSSIAEVQYFIEDARLKYTDMLNTVKTIIQQCEQRVQNHAEYIEAQQAASDWLGLMADRLTIGADTSGDKHSMANKMDRLEASTVFHILAVCT